MTDKMEPERNIEKLLRAFAKKRRNEAGDAFKLHPATRRLLQGEVARRNPSLANDETSPTPTLWMLFRQRLALVLSIVVILFISVVLLLPGLKSAKRNVRSVAAMNNLKQIGMAAKMSAEANDGQLPASLEALTNGLVTDRILIDPQNGQRFAYLGDGKNLSNLQPDSVLAYSAEDKKGRAVLLADGSVTYAKPEQFSALMNHGLPELARAGDSAHRQLTDMPTPAASALPEIASAKEKSSGEPVGGTVAGTDFGMATNTLSIASTARDRSHLDLQLNSPVVIADSTKVAFGEAQKFIQADNAIAQNLFKNTAVQTRAVPVLANFQVQQNGNTISVLDADGSVYKGSFNTEIAVAQNQSISANATPAPGVPPPMQGKDSDAAKKIQSVIVNNSFRVSGLNQTLKQNVVFTGNLLEITAIAPVVQSNAQTGTGSSAAFGKSQISSANQSQAALWSNTRITGTAVIDKTNLVEINAVPLAP